MRFIVLGFCILSFLSVAHANYTPEKNGSPLTLSETSSNRNWGSLISGVVSDENGKWAPKASLILDGKEYFTDERGRFEIAANGTSSPLLVKFPGFRKMSLQPRSGSLDVRLPYQPINGIYVPWGELANDAALQHVLSLLETTELNAVVLDVKGDGGELHFNLEQDSQGRIIEAADPKLKKAVDFLHQHGIYAIARVVSFKDTRYSRQHADLGLKCANNCGFTNPHDLWADKKGNTYLNPYSEAAGEYIVNIAKIAALSGFDEVQFDYVRFPTDGDLKSVAWSKPYNAANRTDAIAAFLSRARSQLGPLGVFVAADIFGIAAYEKNDISAEGQNIEKISPLLDYICPMVYPSGFAMNTSHLGNPVDHPLEIVEDSIGRIRVRASDFSVIRPWLQSFRDYAYNHRLYGAEEICAQIEGSDKAGGEGFLLWNAAGHYTDAGLKAKNSTGPQCSNPTR